MADGNDKVLWGWPEGVSRVGLWAYVWPAPAPCYHRYREDGSSWCGEGPRYEGETKTPGGPWCRTCVDFTAIEGGMITDDHLAPAEPFPIELHDARPPQPDDERIEGVLRRAWERALEPRLGGLLVAPFPGPDEVA